MQYLPDVYIKASNILEQRRTKAISDAEKKKSELYKKIPELQTIDYSIAKLYSAKDIISGKEIKSKDVDTLMREKEDILKKAGYSCSDITPHYYCSKCEDTGRVSGILCSCYKDLCTLLAMKELYSVSEAEKCSFDNFSLEYYEDTGISNTTNPRYKMALIYDFCRKYAKTFSTGSESIIMAGKTGLGKTHLSLSIAKMAIEAGAGVIYRPAQRLFSEIESEHFDRLKNNFTESVIKCDLLIVDDLGAEFSNQFTIATISNIINERLVSGLPTIISTNLTPSELEEMYTERTVSRIFGNYRRLGFVGKDIRLQKKGTLE